MPINQSIIEGRQSDVEALNLVNQVLNSGSPISNRLTSFQNPQPSPAPYIPSANVSSTPVVPEFQSPMRNEVRETVDISTQQMASITTFTPVNIDDIPIKPSKEHADHSSTAHEYPNEVENTTLASIEIPKYDFEEILQKALKEQGIDPNESPKQPPKKPKSKKPKFLKRKKTYDPREAIKKDKEKKSKWPFLVKSLR